MSTLQGVHHAAFVMWEPEKTVRFYRDLLGFPVIHCITAKGWGQEGHADFVHIFFDAGGGNVIAFFHYFGEQAREQRSKDYIDNGRHTALRASSRAELEAWRDKLIAAGVNVSPVIEHEVIASIYFTDPNGYPLEITANLREFNGRDRRDAELTVEAFLAAVKAGEDSQGMWKRKGELVRNGNAVRA
jgi:catechol 2,3-dioxygenase-like lactoylglutathione lyase family enzyme